MRVLINTPDLRLPGGVANYYSTIEDKFGVDVDYFFVGRRTEDESRISLIRRVITDYFRFYRLLRNENYDIVHLNPSLQYMSTIRDGIFHLIAKSLGKPTIIFIRGWDVKCEHGIKRWFLAPFRYMYFSTNAFILLAGTFKEFIVEAGYTGPVYLETTVADDSIFDSCIKGTGGKVEKGDDVINILFMSRLDKDKGIYEAIDAYNIALENHPGLRLCIAGSGAELDAARQYVEERNISGVTFPGFVKGKIKHNVWRNADIYLFPTRFGEGMPNAVLEAMSYGVPVVTRPVGGVRDFFEDGMMGYITEETDAQSFSNLLLRLIEDEELRCTIGTYNREYAQKRFRATKVVERLQGIYDEVFQGA